MSNNTSDKPMKMSQFFDEKASGYEDHMKQTIPSFDKTRGIRQGDVSFDIPS